MKFLYYVYFLYHKYYDERPVSKIAFTVSVNVMTFYFFFGVLFGLDIFHELSYYIFTTVAIISFIIPLMFYWNDKKMEAQTKCFKSESKFNIAIKVILLQLSPIFVIFATLPIYFIKK
ncbi:MAG: hypothetical protein K2X86_12525 [Cytophagaceae bacterium]|nr:hypothetical protein [Cytophagaceae bacterium]